MIKFESSVLCTFVAYISHLRYFIPHLMNMKADYGFKFLEKLISKKEKPHTDARTLGVSYSITLLKNFDKESKGNLERLIQLLPEM